MLAISLDGRLALPAGGPAQLGGDGDRAVLEAALAWADGCLIGAGTLRSHRCTCLIRDPALLEARVSDGRPPQPTALVVSASSRPEFPLEWQFFQQPLDRWLLHANQASEFAITSPGFSHQLGMGPTWQHTLALLAARGMQRLVLLGGAALAASCLQDDVVDELQLTLTPRVVGGRHGWVPFEVDALPSSLAMSDAWRLHKAERLQGDELLVRYQRRHSTHR